MDLSEDYETLPAHNIAEGPEIPQDLSLCSPIGHTEIGCTILLQLLEFKTHLLEAVEELHIRRDTETRFEGQIGKVVLEKQELEWEKESLQHRIETVANQHNESLINVRKQLQAKIRNLEEEKGKYQVTAELKEKEITNLKEQLKLLQLQKYNFEKKSSELEHKLTLQNRSKDSHLSQMGEVEKRFSALSRQCAMVKQDHERLQQNVEEAMRINKKSTSANEKQEATILTLKKELEEVSNKLIKAKMSSVPHDKTHIPPHREHHVQQLHHKLHMETETIKKLRDENVDLQTEKLEVLKSLQHTQQLLLSQTQTVGRIELERQTQGDQYQVLKQEHEVMQEKRKAMEDKVAQLMESYAASKTVWDKEKTMFMDRIKRMQQDLQEVNESYDRMQQKHTELSAQVNVQGQQIPEQEMTDCSQSHGVSTQLFPTLMEGTRGVRPLNEPDSSSTQPSFGSPGNSAFSQTRNPDCLQDTRAVATIAATDATRGQESPNQPQRCKNTSPNLFTNSLLRLCDVSGTTGSDENTSVNNSKNDLNVVSDLICNTSSLYGDELASKGSCESGPITALSPDHRSRRGSVELPTDERKSDEEDKGMGRTDQSGRDVMKLGNKNIEEEVRNKLEHMNREEIQGEDEKDTRAEEKRGTSNSQTTDREDSQECSGGGIRESKTETKDKGECEGRNGEEERGKAETEIQAQTTGDKKSKRLSVIDLDSSETLLTACEPSCCSDSLPQKDVKKDEDSSHVDKGCGMLGGGQFESIDHMLNPVVQEVKDQPCQDDVQTYAESPDWFPSAVHEASEPSDKSAADFPAEPQSTSSQTSASQSGGRINIQDLQTIQMQTETGDPSNITSNMNHADEICATDENGKVMFGTMTVESQESPQTEDTSEQGNGQMEPVVTDSDAQERDDQTNLNGDRETAQEFNSEDVCVDITMDNVDHKSQLDGGCCDGGLKNDKQEAAADSQTTEGETDFKPSVHGSLKSYDNDVLDADDLPPPKNKTYRSSFAWGGAKRQADSPLCEQSGSGGFFGPPPSKMFHTSNHNKVPLVITRASDLLNAFSVSGKRASLRRHQQGEWEAIGETCGVTAAAAADGSRTSPSLHSRPVSTSSSAVSTLSWQTTSGCSRLPRPGVAPGSDSDREPLSPFRAQMSKIEQFLETERLHLPKRRQTDN